VKVAAVPVATLIAAVVALAAISALVASPATVPFSKTKFCAIFSIARIAPAETPDLVATPFLSCFVPETLKKSFVFPSVQVLAFSSVECLRLALVGFFTGSLEALSTLHLNLDTSPVEGTKAYSMSLLLTF